MSNHHKVLAVLLATLLMFSFINWSTSRELRQQLSNLQGEMRNLRSLVSVEMSQIQGTVTQIREEARWWVPGEVDFSFEEPDRARVKISWVLKEYQEGGQVGFYYRGPGGEEYVAAPVQEKSPGHYRALLTLELPREPRLAVIQEVIQERETGRGSAVRVIEEKSEWGYPHALGLQYYMTLQQGESRLTSETQYLGLSELSFRQFHPLELRVSLPEEEGGEIGLVLQEMNISPGSYYQHHFKNGVNNYTKQEMEVDPEPYYQLEEVHLETRDARGGVQEQWPFPRINLEESPGQARQYRYPEIAIPHHYHGVDIYEKDLTPSRPYQDLYLILNYSRGLVVEKKVY